jgi:hypothetical protein
MFHRYRYEAAFYTLLNRIPLDARMKLDLTGIKISLKDWLAYGFEERAVLCHLPVDTTEEKQAFAAYIDFLSRTYRGQPAETTQALEPTLWDSVQVPEAVTEKSRSCAGEITVQEWQNWATHQRYALYKTAISKSQPEAFADILDELRGAQKSRHCKPTDHAGSKGEA